MTGLNEDDDLEQFMEVITQYKCKFCEFTASTTRDIALHVKSIHVKKEPVQLLQVQDRTSEVNMCHTDIIQGNIGREENVVIPQDSQEMVNSELPAGVNHFNGRNYLYNNSTSNVIESGHTMYTSSSNSTLEVPYTGQTEALSEGGVIITLSNGDQNISLSTQSDIVRESMPVDAEQNISNFQFIKQNADGQYIIQNSENVNFDKTGTVQVLVQEGNNLRNNGLHDKAVGMTDSYEDSIIMTESAVNSLPTEMDKHIVHGTDLQQTDLQGMTTDQPDDGDVVTKELYLCGSCSECFTSIQDCKEHMTNIHEVTDFQTSGKVDMGTQMEPKKKVGRKKKSEKVKEVIEEEEIGDELVLSESDEDWTEQMMAYTTRSRRARKPPKALQSDYYLGRTKKKEPVKRSEQLGLNVKCTVKGCLARFKDQDTMESHLRCHIAGAAASEHQFRCLCCEETFPIWKQARHHMWKVHREDIGCLLSCEVCNNFKTDVMSKLKVHYEIHSDDRPYACSVCGKGFKQFAQMKNHEHCHTDSSDHENKWHSPQTCDICGRRFANVKCMKMHRQAVHGDKKQFKCEYCNYECTRKAMLVLHTRTHTGVKPYKCDICTYSCSDHNSLRRHKMRHSGVKPYKCPHCPYSCIQAISLKVHIKNKHPGMEGIYCCDMCLFRTVNELQYNNHLNDHKNGLIKTEIVKQDDPPPQNQYFVMKNVPGKDGIVLSRADGRFETLTSQDSVIQVLQAPDIQRSTVQHILQVGGTHSMPSSNVQHMLQTGGTQTMPSSTYVLDGDQVRQLQIRMNETGENVVVEEGFSDIVQGEQVEGESLPQNDITAAQLIYTALNAIAKTEDTGTDTVDSQELIEGVETGTIQTSIEADSSRPGETTYVITFHLPDGGELKKEVTLQEESVVKEEMSVVHVQDTNWPVM